MESLIALYTQTFKQRVTFGLLLISASPNTMHVVTRTSALVPACARPRSHLGGSALKRLIAHAYTHACAALGKYACF